MTNDEIMLELYREDLVTAERRLKRNRGRSEALAEMDLGRVRQLKKQIADTVKRI